MSDSRAVFRDTISMFKNEIKYLVNNIIKMTTKGTRFDSDKSCTVAGSYLPISLPDTMKIYGGIYVISEDKDSDFREQYYEKVFIKGESEYMTEKQPLKMVLY